MQEINCLFCDKSNDNVVIRENGYTGQQCTCGLIYVSPRPSLDEIIDVYGHDDAHSSADAQIHNEFAKRLSARHHLRKLLHHKNSGTLLEIGAGAGYFLDESRKLGFEPYGIELNQLQADFIRSHHQIPCEELPLENYPDSSYKFDVVYHCDVISHFYDPRREFQLMHDAMSENGILMFETGNYGDMEKRFYKHVPRFQYPDHLFFFSEENLKTLLDRTGFELLAMHSYSTLPHLHFRGAARKLASLLPQRKGRKKNAVDSGSAVSESKVINYSGGGSGIKAGLKNIWAYLNHVVRYKVGRVYPERGEPRTLLLIARKRSTRN